MLKIVTITLLAVALRAPAADKKPTPVYVGTVLDFAEERYNEPRFLGGGRMDSCVNRDYTIEVTKAIYVLRQSSPTPASARLRK
jgi:hypothetical protein